MDSVFNTLADASAYARKQRFAKSTRSIGLAVRRNNRERVYHFDQRGNCTGWEHDGELIPWETPITARSLTA